MATNGDSKESTTTFRWLDAARYVLALVMTILVLAVTVNAIKVVLRPEVLSVSVPGGSVPFSNNQPPPSPSPLSQANKKAKPEITLDAGLRFYNPSGRVRMYYINITVYLFGNDSRATSSADPAADAFFYFSLRPKVVAQLGTVETHLLVHLSLDPGVMVKPYPYFTTLYSGGGVINGVTMRIEGDLITEVVSGLNKTAPHTMYSCAPVVVGGDPDDRGVSKRPDVSCTELLQSEIGK